jgi:type VI protein secretion system component VasK
MNSMEQIFKKLKQIFWLVFGEFALLSMIVIVLKRILHVKDFIGFQSKITVVGMLLMLILILLAYFIYDRYAKKSQKIENDNDEEKLEQQLELYKKAMIVKMIMFNSVGTLSAIMLFLLYQRTYLYMIGIVAVFFFISFPSEIRFKRDFLPKRQLFE